MRDDDRSIRSGVKQSVSFAKLGFLELRPKRACNRIGRDPHQYSAVVAEQSVPMPKCKCSMPSMYIPEWHDQIRGALDKVDWMTLLDGTSIK